VSAQRESAGQGNGVLTAPDNALVHCEAVARTYGNGPQAVPAVRGVTSTVHRGVRIALTGPSGSGKSTLLHLMAGLEQPTSGSVRWPELGGPPAGRPGIIGMVFQGPSLVPALDVVENVALPLLLAGASRADAIAQALLALDRLAIGELATTLPEEISGGQAQRVAVARVLASRPRLILADEPTGQLDSATGARVVSVLLETAAELDAALVVATHDLSVADRLPTRWVMADGRLTDTEETPR
jgi:putative ABC transport system ATP-binding protein